MNVNINKIEKALHENKGIKLTYNNIINIIITVNIINRSNIK